MAVYSISQKPYYDNSSQKYVNVLVLNEEPDDILKQIVKKITIPDIGINRSGFQKTTCYKTGYAFMDSINKNDFADIITITVWLNNNGYEYINICNNGIGKLLESNTLFIKKTN